MLRFNERIQPTTPGHPSVSLAHTQPQPDSFTTTRLVRLGIAGASTVLLGGAYIYPHPRAFNSFDFVS